MSRLLFNRGVRSVAVCVTAAFVVVDLASVQAAVVLDQEIVSETQLDGAFPLVADENASFVMVDEDDWAGVVRAVGDLQLDVERVTGKKPVVSTSDNGSKYCVIVGTLGKSKLIDALVSNRKLDASDLKGKWESFVITTIDNPAPGVTQALVIAGSDKRGAIYGIYELSEQLGVSPWYWWADVPPKKRTEAYVLPGRYVSGEPVVKYRGIFINDEEPCLGPWSREKFGGVNSKMYTHMFELILRLRGNYLWPAMWGKAFNEDDPLNPKLADEYGIVMGTSHHEPMMRAQKEWTDHRGDFGNGEWNYLTNAEGLRKFWREGMERNKEYDNLVTMGMRGDGDMKMEGADSFEENKKLLERIVQDQRKILADVCDSDVSRIPQLWAIYTEVQDYYDAGIDIPDDVTLMFTDDNVGNLRRIPTAADRKRSGGAGIYMHMDMNGGPFSYKWLNSNPLPKIWEQMNIAHQYGANRIWIANVGDLKPLEVPIEFFLRMAWNPDAMTKDRIAEYQLRRADRDFGPAYAEEIADIVSKYAKYNNWRKPELLKPDTFSFVNYHEAERVSLAWGDLVARAEKLNAVIPQEQRDAFYELVLHPVRACANLNEMYLAAGRNALFAKQGRTSANAEAARVRELFRKDQGISDYYNNTLANGKWHHMMDQTHIGYTDWQSPRENIMPTVVELELPNTTDFGVAVEGSTEAWPGSSAKAELPVFDSINRQVSWIDVFSRGSQEAKYEISTAQPWIELTEGTAPGAAGTDHRIQMTIDWDRLPAGESAGSVVVAGANGTVPVVVKAIKATDAQVREAKGCFGGLAGPIAFLAEDCSANVSSGNARWEKIPDYGRGPSAMEVFPVTTDPIEPGDPAPRLEYPVYFAHAGIYEVELVTAPTLDMIKGLGQRIAVSIDDQPLEVVRVFNPDDPASYKDVTPYFSKTYHKTASDNARTMHFTQTVKTAGKHTLRITMVDPAVVVQKIIVHDGNLPASYFGPLAGAEEFRLSGVVIEAEAVEPVGGAATVVDSAASGGCLVGLAKPDAGLRFDGLPAASKLAIRYASVDVGTISVAVNDQPARKVNVHSSGATTEAFLHAIIDVAIPAKATLTISLADNDVPVTIDRIVVGEGDLGLPPDIWNLSALEVAEGPYAADWEEIGQRYTVPEWWREAKFGAWSHWDPQSMPEQGDWYARGMYMPGNGQYDYHLKTFGPPSEYGYKEICRDWKIDRWNPEALMELYVEMGARYFMAMGVHHDNYDCWDSKYQPWNSVNVGPKVDIVGTWEKVARKHGLRFGIGFHNTPGRTWGQFMTVRYTGDRSGPEPGVPYDALQTIFDGKGSWWEGLDPVDLYGRNMTNPTRSIRPMPTSSCGAWTMQSPSIIPT